MKMHNPPHPGEVLRKLCLEPMNLTVTDAARSLGVSRKALSSILNGRTGISPEMAVRLSIAFDTSAESWLSLTFALNGHFRPSGRRILFAFNGGSAETAQVKTLPLF